MIEFKIEIAVIVIEVLEHTGMLGTGVIYHVDVVLLARRTVGERYVERNPIVGIISLADCYTGRIVSNVTYVMVVDEANVICNDAVYHIERNDHIVSGICRLGLIDGVIYHRTHLIIKRRVNLQIVCIRHIRRLAVIELDIYSAAQKAAALDNGSDAYVHGIGILLVTRRGEHHNRSHDHHDRK